jgi:general secretion pathway protein J
VRLGETTERREFVTVRSRTRFAPLPPSSSLSQHLHFSDPVVLLRAPFRLSFAYAGKDRIWKDTWRNSDTLPAMIRLTVRDAATERVLSVSTVTPVHIQVPSDCARPDGACDGDANAPQKTPDETRPGIAAAGQGGSL